MLILTRGFLIILFLTFTSKVYSQRMVLKPSDSNSAWYNLEEWIYANSNLSFQSHDQTYYELYSPGYSGKLYSGMHIYINNQKYHAQWLNKDRYFVPNFSLSNIDSIVVDYHSFNKFNEFSPSGTIEIFTTNNENSISFERALINPINDPGPHLITPLKTTNVEGTHDIIKTNLNTNILGLSTSFFYSRDDYPRTNRLVYDRAQNSVLSNRTRNLNPDHDTPQAIRKIFYGMQGSYETSRAVFRSSLSMNDVTEHHPWHSLSGIEVPSSIDHYQASLSFDLKKSSFYKGSTFNFNSSISDTLNYTPVVYYGVKESRFSHQSNFLFNVGTSPYFVSFKTLHYHIIDRFTNMEYDFLEYGIAAGRNISEDFKIYTSISNTDQVIEFEKRISDSFTFHINSGNSQLNKNTYTYELWNQGIGFSSLNSSEHQVSVQTDFRQSWSSLKMSGTTHQNLSYFITAKHFWQLVNHDVSYSPRNKTYKLDSTVMYFDSKNIAFLGFQSLYKIAISPQVSSRTMLGGNLYLYGNERLQTNFERVPSFVFTQQMQYKPHENAAFDFTFRYLPPRYINEYQNLEELTGWPPVRVRPIKMVNVSSTMWFFDRTLELNVTLRNILNLAESYDTNGQYYYMSLNVKGKIYFKPKRLN